MNIILRCTAIGAVLMGLFAPAHAAILTQGGTGTLGGGGFTFLGGGATTDWDNTRPGVWTNAVTDPASF